MVTVVIVTKADDWYCRSTAATVLILLGQISVGCESFDHNIHADIKQTN